MAKDAALKQGASALEKYNLWKQQEKDLLAEIAAEAAPAIQAAVDTLKQYAEKSAKDAVMTALKEAGLVAVIEVVPTKTKGKRKSAPATEAEIAKVEKALSDKFVLITDIAEKAGMKSTTAGDAAKKLVADDKAVYQKGKGRWGMFKKK